METATATAPIPASAPIPGPSAPAVVQTAQWLAGPIEFLERCRERYGEAFRVHFLAAGEMVVISDPDALKQLFGQDRTNRMPKGRTVLLEPVMGPRSILLQEDEEHLRRRRLMLPPFHGERMKAYEGLIAEIAAAEVAGWSEGEQLELHPRMQAITLEVIMRAVFGVTDQERLAELRQLLPQLLTMVESGRSQVIGLTTRRLGKLGPWRVFQRVVDRIDALIAAEVAARRSDPDLGEREDILSLLVAARDEDGEGMGDDELRDQLMTLLVAGHETTATALAWTFDLLFRHPPVMERLTGELATNGAEYLDAVIEESLRLRPVVPFTGRELAAPATLDGLALEQGTVVMASIYLAHTRGDVYPEPHEFRPERFLDGNVETYSWIPFGGGMRRCLGASFALMEMQVVLRTILTTVALRGTRSEAEPVVRRNITFSPKHGTPALVERRLAVS
ncbi:MAG: cytochrome family [Solirubrobacterales bacterium]|nr:cytochrome family [Solirubrobacterales bacterium]